MKTLKTMCSLWFVCLSILAILSCTSKQQPEWVGKWKSVTRENIGNGLYATREFNINEKDWDINFIVYSDSLGTNSLFKFYGAGPLEIQEDSKLVPGAKNAIFRFNKKTLTLLTDDQNTINSLGFAACGLQKEVEKDISANGCSFLPSVANYGQEYDLIALRNGQLFLGARSNDLSTEDKRPTTLGAPLNKTQ